MQIIHKKILIKFEFRFGPMIFDRVMPIGLRKKWEIRTFRSFNFEVHDAYFKFIFHIRLIN